jgi:hypothetical protein
MAITVGTITTHSGNQNAAGAAFSHNNDGDYLLVGIMQGYADSAAVPTGVTYNGVAMTKIGEVAYGSNHAISVWELVAPAAGAHTVAPTFTDFNIEALVAVSLSGVHQTTPHGTVVTASNANTTPSVTVSSATGELVVDFVAVKQNSTATATVGSGQTQRANLATTVNPVIDVRGLVSTEAGAASVTMDWTLSASESWKAVGVPVKPAGGGGGGTDTMLPMMRQLSGGFSA